MEDSPHFPHAKSNWNEMDELWLLVVSSCRDIKGQLKEYMLNVGMACRAKSCTFIILLTIHMILVSIISHPTNSPFMMLHQDSRDSIAKYRAAQIRLALH